MKIIYDYQIFYDQKFGGVSRYFVELFKSLRTKCEIKIVAPISKNHYLSSIGKGTKIVDDDRGLLRKIDILINMICVIFNVLFNKVDIIHLTWNRPYLPSFCDKKTIVTIHDMIHEMYWKDVSKKEIKNKREVIYRSAAIIAISENTKNDILKIYPEVPKEKIQVIYHGVNHLGDAKEPTCIKTPEKYILYVGTRFDYKGYDFWINVIPKILRYDSSFKFIFCGGGCFSNDEISTLKQLKIYNDVIQCNVTDNELAYLYRNALCFVYPTKYEGFGFPVLEAFDNCCPVICTNSSSLPEVGGDAALYFDENDEEMLINLIFKIDSDSSFRNEYINKGKERAKQFTWEKCAKNTMEVYKKVATINSTIV